MREALFVGAGYPRPQSMSRTGAGTAPLRACLIVLCLFLFTSCSNVGDTTTVTPKPAPASSEEQTEEVVPADDDEDDEGPVSIAALEIALSDVVLAEAGEAVHLAVTLTFSDGNLLADVHRYYFYPAGGIAGQLVWKSDDPQVATVSSIGFVRARAAGVTVVSCTDPWEPNTPVARVLVTVLADAVPEEPDPSPEPPDDPPPPDPPDDPEDPIVEEPLPQGADAYADHVVSYAIGTSGGFNEEFLPDIVLGPPLGAGCCVGSLDVFSLGQGGEIILEMTDYIIFDGSGDDFIVFENGFEIGGDPNNVFSEPGIVAVSEDGETYYEFPCDLSGQPYPGCAGTRPTLANQDDNNIDPTDPQVAGGNGFDLATVGLQTARFIRIQDSDLDTGPIGPGTAGFDLDAISIVHGTSP